MNDDTRRQEIEFIREEQARLRSLLARLDRRIEALAMEPTAAVERVEVPPPAPVVVQEMPPPLPQFPMPVVHPPVAMPAVSVPAEPLPAESSAADAPPPMPGATSAPEERRSLEVEIGTTWLVRIAIVLLLTGIVFLGGWLYQNVVPHLGPAAKVALLYLASGALAGAGAWLERKAEKDPEEEKSAQGGLRQYARVVFAGGLAAVYYVTYAAHWNLNLRVVESPLLAGAMMLGWTAFMVYLAHRRSSETLATFAILLAYYTSSINEIAGFTLYSNLVLTIAAVFLLRRHLWAVFPFASLLATYGSYGFWRYFHVYLYWRAREEIPTSAIGSGGLWMEGTFLAIYWLLFTWVIFAPPTATTLTRAREGTFAGLNNGAFFALSTWVLLAEYPGKFWLWALVFGTVLVALAEAGRILRQPFDPRTEATYHTGGILLITWGIVSYFSGWHLSLALAIESTALTLAASRRGSRLFLEGARVTAFLSLLWTVQWAWQSSLVRTTWLADATCGGFLMFNAWWCQRLREQAVAASPEPGATSEKLRAALPLSPAYFSLLGCVIWGAAMMHYIDNEMYLAPVLVAAAVILTGAVYGLRIGPLAVYAQGYVLCALLVQVANFDALQRSGGQFPLWNPVVMLAGILALGHWWEQKRWAGFLSQAGWKVWAVVDAVVLVCVLAIWLEPRKPGGNDIWCAESAALAVLLFGYGLATNYRAVAFAGQYFQVASVAAATSLWWHSWDGNAAEPMLTLAPIVSALAVVATGHRFAPRLAAAGNRGWSWLATAYEAVAMGLIIGWGSRYFPHPEKFALFALVGGMIVVFGAVRRELRWLLWSGAPILAGLIVYWGDYNRHEEAGVVNLVGIAVLAALQQFGRRRLPVELFPTKAQAVVITLATLVGWTWVSAMVAELAPEGTFTLAAGWSLFAAVVFAAGFLWKESTYRWLGLGLLACTLARIVLYDIWQLDSLGRILSSFALGFVLLAIAFVYTKFQKQLRNWF